MTSRPAPATSALLAVVCWFFAAGAAGAQQLERPPPQPLVAPPVDAVSAGETPQDGAEAPALLPPGFLDSTLPISFDQAVGVAVGPDERLYVWEREGSVWFVEDGVKHDHPLLDIAEEVASWGDHGLMGFALDPDFLSNGFLYVLYVVDYHHLTTFGTPAYDPQVSINGQDTIARVTRYTVDLVGGGHDVLPGSRLVLIGEDINSGLPVCNVSHAAGTLAFGEDDTLLVSFGDSFGAASSNTCLSDGILTADEDVGRWRAQFVNSLAGKILRVDPATGNGVPSNPWYDPLAPRAPRSRVWALGLRNPFRFGLRPGTGKSNPALADPGTLLIGDVGEGDWEELDVADVAGVNFGWPAYEGMDPFIDDDPIPANPDAPNPLFGIGGCAQEFFLFPELLAPDSQFPPSWPNPCDPFQQVPASVPTFQHRRPVIDWSHTGVSRASVYDLQGLPIAEPLAPGASVPGPQFGGIAAVAGAWHGGADFPAPYQDAWYQADYGAGWIHAVEFDANDRPVEVHPFAQVAGAVVAIASDDAQGLLYYINYLDPTDSKLHEIRFVPGNQPPVAKIKANATWGKSPLVVQFDGTASSDPEGGALRWAWDFGDGTPISHLPKPVHIFPTVDISPLGDIVSKLDTMVPPMPMGLGSLDTEVIRDGDYPPPGTTDLKRQGLYFQEGLQYVDDGGWFDSFTVQVRVGIEWEDVTGLVVSPAYGEFVVPTYERYEISFDPVVGSGIRLYGDPGGDFEFISVGELRVLAAPPAWPGNPANFTVSMRVLDPLATDDIALQDISVDNSPPQVRILNPPNGATYPDDMSQMVSLVGSVLDAEHDAGQLDCEWQVLLHHNDHVHPDPVLTQCLPTTTLVPHGADGDLHYYEVRFTATDPLGLSDTTSHFVIPDNDLNLNGIDDAIDIASGTSLDLDTNGVPDEAETDCNGNGLSDLMETTVGLTPDLDGNLVPDECDPVRLEVLPHSGVPPLKPL
jgi:glucose/arabinose dehydrogenase